MNARSVFGRRYIPPVALALAVAAFAPRADAATFNVTTTLDAAASPAAVNQGVCDDGQGQCTLRAAIQVADAASTPTTIVVPAGTYTLTVAGTDESAVLSNGTYAVAHVPDAGEGDLNITQSMTIIGAGSSRTVIGWAAGSQQDRVLHIEVPPGATQNLSVTIQGVTIENGYVPAPLNLDASVPTAVVRLARMGGGIAIGAGAEIQTVDSTVTEGGEDEGGCGGKSGGGGACAGPEGHGGPGESETGATLQRVTLSDVRVVGNHAGGEGGGIYNTGPITLDHVVVEGNSSDANGGGLYNDAVMLMTDSIIGSVNAPNTAGNGGGLFETGFHTSVIERSAFIGNVASAGAGIAGRRMVLQIISRSTIADNSARDGGGGIQTNGRVELVNATVAGNTVSGTPGNAGVGLNGFGPASQLPAGGAASAANYTLVNSIIADNAYVGSAPVLRNCGGNGEGDPAARFHSMGHNIEDGDTCGLTGAGDRFDVNPLLGPLADNGGATPTMALMMGSPAIDTGDSAACPNEDQRGQMGRADGNLDGVFSCDVGAYELFVHTADLHMDKVSAPDRAYVGDTFGLSATVHVDPGATAASTGVQVVTSPLPAQMTLSSASIASPSGTQDCTATAGVVTCNAGTLEPGQTATLSLVVAAAAEDAAADITFAATQMSPLDQNPGNNAALAQTALVGNADLNVRSSGASTTVTNGGRTFTSFSVANTGPDTATNVRVGMSLPDNVSYDSVDFPGANCSYDGIDRPATVICTITSLSVGQSLAGLLTVTAVSEGTGTTTFAVDGLQRDVNLSDNEEAAVLSVTGANVVESVSSGGGGCVSLPGGGFDPALIVLALAGGVGLLRSRERRGKARTDK